jgi:formylglycine-generating enzyme required for sulfatase activity
MRRFWKPLLCAVVGAGLLGLAAWGEPLPLGSDDARDSLLQEARMVDFAALRRAIVALQKSHPGIYPDTGLAKLDAYEKEFPALLLDLDKASGPAGEWISRQATLETSALMPQHSEYKDRLLTGDCPNDWAFHSLEADKPWIIIDLGKVQKIGALRIVNRQQAVPDRARKLVASVSLDKQEWKELWRNQGAARMAWNIDLADPAEARYVKLWLDDRSTFHLKSVKLFAPAKSSKPQTGRTPADKVREILDWRRATLLANPAIDFDKILCIRRPAQGSLGLPQNWESNSSLNPAAWPDELAILPIRTPAAPLATFFKPVPGCMISDVDLNFAADRLLFSMRGKNGRWQIHEMGTDGNGLHELPLIPDNDVDNYDACYLPDGNLLFTSTAPFVGVPCVQGSSHVTNCYLYTPKTGAIRRLTFDQEHNWCPTVLNNGQILYQRWEYSDLPHFAARILFSMNPDGTNQRAYYGSNSYWPNAIFYARPIPGHPSQVVGIVGGHHGVPRMGELVIFDPAKGRYEADGVVQRLPGFGKPVKPVIVDQLVDDSWPKFLHPYPLSGSLFLVSAKLTPQANWGLYLIDIYDNLLLLKEEPGMALFEPVPVKRQPTPPVIPSRIDPQEKTATVFIQDIYVGEGLKGVPRGTVKQLRLFTYQFAYHTEGGQVNRVGLTGPWDIKRMIGTVPVNADGSAFFRIPANTPISIQPLDDKGQALALMRSWMTAMPGETLSCIGCHESANSVPAITNPLASKRPIAEIAPWHGPIRGFGFRQEVQPALDRLCVGCHNGAKPERPDFRDLPEVAVPCRDNTYKNGSKFSPAYLALRSHVRSATIEADLHLLLPGEFQANTSEVVQMLRKGHHGVAPDADFWDRLNTWIDLGTPYHGSWASIVGTRIDHFRIRRIDLLKRYGGRDDDEETVATIAPAPASVMPPAPVAIPDPLAKAAWGFSAEEATKRQQALGETKQTLDLGNGIRLELVRIPAGDFIMGSTTGADDERPLAKVHIAKPFWIGRYEITNAQYASFDPAHDSRREPPDFLQFSERERGYSVNEPDQPVCRISWLEAQAFCQWLATRTGRQARLPTEVQWEWACRAGTAGSFYFGDGLSFEKYANLADRTFRTIDTWGWGLPSGAVPEWRAAIVTQDDHTRVSAPVGKYLPNPWGLHDMCGNVAEWTRNDAAAAADKVARGGSWYDLPYRATSSYRIAYPPWQKVFNVGFRIIIEE